MDTKYDDSPYQVLPDMSPDEYEKLKQDITENGLQYPVVYDENGAILDGHHRYKIGLEIGLDMTLPEYRSIKPGLTEPQKYTFALSMNMNRRHLTRDQRRQAIRKALIKAPTLSNRQLADAAGVDHKTIASIRDEMIDNGEIPQCDTLETTDGRRYPAKKSAPIVYGPNNRDAEALKRPEIVDRIAAERCTVPDAIRAERLDEITEQLENIENKAVKAAQGLYDVIIIDPPWPMEKIETNQRPNQVKMDYPTMSIDEIRALDVPAADPCHVFLWTTQKFLPDAMDIIKSWGLKYTCLFTWHKNTGMNPFGMPFFNSEFVIYARKGSPVFIREDNFKTCFNADTAGHSVKPDAFYDMIQHVTAGRRLDMFNRRKIDGFDGWGKESPDDGGTPPSSDVE